MERGMDPEIKRYFRKILSTISYGLTWLMSVVTAGIYFRLGWQEEKPLAYVIIFYVCAALSFFILLRYYYRIWRK